MVTSAIRNELVAATPSKLVEQQAPWSPTFSEFLQVQPPFLLIHTYLLIFFQNILKI